ncbi:cell wall protein Ecm33 [Entomophthora muscae]|uniref:Cell wall protein Ecm33 n=1 Tax=Entomophthora muscae TaxID=34485 RepID=A0ACC2UFQ4_9FUNG|nr:cell wall protein Ecm33 [Entomophthora muscae]
MDFKGSSLKHIIRVTLTKCAMNLQLIFHIAYAVADQCSEDHFITQSEELIPLRACVKMMGIFSLNFKESSSVALPLLQEAGDLIIAGAGVERIYLPQLVSAGRFSVLGTLNLTALEVPKFQYSKAIGLVGTGNLKEVIFEAGLMSLESMLVLGTKLRRIKGIAASTVEYISLKGNRLLEELLLHNLTSISDSISFMWNGAGLVFDAPYLHTIQGDMTVDDLSNINLPSLQFVGGGVHISNLEAYEINLPVQHIGAMLTIQDCPLLSSILMQELKQVSSSMVILENGELTSLGMESLELVEGDLVIRSEKLTQLMLNSDLTDPYSTTIHANIDCQKFVSKHQHKLHNLECISTA